MPNASAQPALSLLGAVAGGIVGSVVTVLLANRGLYALVLPGAFLGAGCGAFSNTRSQIRGILCGLAGLALGLLVYWWVGYFEKDPSLIYFLANVHRGILMFLVMVVLGGLAAYWFGGDTFWWWRRTAKPAGVDDLPREG